MARMLRRPVKYVSLAAVHSLVYFCCSLLHFFTSIEGVAMLGLYAVAHFGLPYFTFLFLY